MDGEPAASGSLAARTTTTGRARLEAVLAAMHDGVVTVTLDGTVLETNPRWCELVGLPADRVIGARPPYPWWPPERAEEYQAILQRLTDGGAWELDLELVRPDGTRAFVAASVTTLHERGVPVGRLAVVRDVTDRRREEAEQHERDAAFRLLAEQATDIVARHAPDGTILWVSPSIEHILGFPPDEAIGVNPLLFQGDAPRESVRAALERLASERDRDAFRFVAPVRAADGSIRWLDVSGKAVRDPDGDLTELHTSSRDVTERVATERELVETRDAFERAQSVGRVGSFTIDLAAGLVHQSDEAFRIAGLEPDPEPWPLERSLDLLHPDDRARAVDDAAALLAGESAGPSIYRLVLPSGELRVVRHRAEVDRAADGTALRIVGTVQDITEQHATEQALRESELRFRAIADAAPLVIWTSDAVGNCTFVNRTWTEVTGLPSAATLGRGWHAAIHPEDRDAMAAAFEEGRARGFFEHTVRFRARDGSWRLFLDRGVVQRGGEGAAEGGFDGFVGVAVDVTEQRATQEALRESEEHFRLLAEHSTDVIARLAPDGTVRYVSPAVRNLFGFEPEQFIGTNPAALLPPKERAAVLQAYDEAARSEGTFRFIQRFPRPDARWVWVETIGRAIRDPRSGDVLELHTAARDVTEREEALAAARAAEAALIRAQQLAGVASFSLDLATGVLETSDTMGVIVGPAFAGSFSSLDIVELVHPDDREHAKAAGRRLLDAGEPIAEEVRVLRPDGSVRWVRAEAAIDRDEHGEPVRVVGTVQDVHERREAEDALRAREERFRLLVDQAVELLIVMRPDGAYDYVSPSVERLTGHPAEDFTLATARAILHPDDTDTLDATFARSLERPRVPLPVAFRFRHPDGTWHRAEGTYTNLVDAEPVGGVVLNAHDVTDRWRATDALARSEAALRSVLDALDEGIMLARAGGGVELANSAAARIVDRPLHELVGSDEPLVPLPVFCPDGRVMPPEEVPAMDTFRTGREHTNDVMGFRTPAGELRWVSVNTRALRSPDGAIEAVVTSFSDITEQRRAEAEARRAEIRFQTMVESISDAVWLLDAGLRVWFASPSTEALLGPAAHEAASGSFLDSVHPDDRLDAQHLLEGLVVHGARTASAAPSLVRLRHADGDWRWVELVATNLLDEPDVGGLLVTGRDVTERRRLEAHLARAGKLEAVGRLAGGIAHDFNNLLTAISGYAELLLADLPPGAPQRLELGEILGAAGRAASLIDQLLAFSQHRAVRPSAVDLAATVRDMETLLRRGAAAGDALAIDLPSEPVTVLADRGQLEQVLLNLVVNARDAIGPGGHIALRVGCVEVTGRGGPAGLAPGSYGLLTVSDDGRGMPPEVAARVFEPFFTTKGPGAGTGLGLATVFGIATQNGGTVVLDTAPGRGATFRVYLPRAAPSERASAPAPRSRPAVGATRRGRVLVVEDEAAIQALAARVLRTAGYTVMQADDAESALAMAEAELPDLLLTDVVLPGMHGIELARLVADRRPGLPVVVMSGFADAAADACGLPDNTGFLAKPFGPDDLLGAVRAALP